MIHHKGTWLTAEENHEKDPLASLRFIVRHRHDGHLYRLVIADAGPPIPDNTTRIGLALTQGVPGAAQTLEVVLEELKVEKAILAEEVKERNPRFLAEVQELLSGVPVEFVSHSELKTKTTSARAVVRTGEFSPYANVMLVSGVVF